MDQVLRRQTEKEGGNGPCLRLSASPAVSRAPQKDVSRSMRCGDGERRENDDSAERPDVADMLDDTDERRVVWAAKAAASTASDRSPPPPPPADGVR